MLLDLAMNTFGLADEVSQNPQGCGRHEQVGEERWVQNSCGRKSVPLEQHQHLVTKRQERKKAD